MRPALLLDVDGVLCPFGAGVPDGYSRYAVRENWAYMSPANAARLERLRQDFDLRWCTAWEDQANEHLLDFHDLKPLPLIRFEGRRHDPKAAHWKLPWIEAWAKDKPFAWIDDEIDDGVVAWADKRTTSGRPTLALAVPHNVGLQDEHVLVLHRWALRIENAANTEDFEVVLDS